MKSISYSQNYPCMLVEMRIQIVKDLLEPLTLDDHPNIPRIKSLYFCVEINEALLLINLFLLSLLHSQFQKL